MLYCSEDGNTRSGASNRDDTWRWLMSLGRVLDQFAVAVDSYVLNSQCDRCCVFSRPEQVQRGCRWQTRDGAPHQE
jgi:hypothetical protein